MTFQSSSAGDFAGFVAALRIIRHRRFREASLCFDARPNLTLKRQEQSAVIWEERVNGEVLKLEYTEEDEAGLGVIEVSAAIFF